MASHKYSMLLRLSWISKWNLVKHVYNDLYVIFIIFVTEQHIRDRKVDVTWTLFGPGKGEWMVWFWFICTTCGSLKWCLFMCLSSSSSTLPLPPPYPHWQSLYFENFFFFSFPLAQQARHLPPSFYPHLSLFCHEFFLLFSFPFVQ